MLCSVELQEWRCLVFAFTISLVKYSLTWQLATHIAPSAWTLDNKGKCRAADNCPPRETLGISRQHRMRARIAHIGTTWFETLLQVIHIHPFLVRLGRAPLVWKSHEHPWVLSPPKLLNLNKDQICRGGLGFIRFKKNLSGQIQFWITCKGSHLGRHQNKWAHRTFDNISKHLWDIYIFTYLYPHPGWITYGL